MCTHINIYTYFYISGKAFPIIHSKELSGGKMEKSISGICVFINNGK
jgi:hypothetical protein